MMHILITGGRGKVGRLVEAALAEANHKISIYDLADDKDIFNRSLLSRELEGVQTVVHLAAIPHPFHRDKTESDYWRVNVDGTMEVWARAKAAGVKRFVFASSGCVYGFWGGHCQPDQFPILETNRMPSRAEGQTVYGATKLAAEEFLSCEAGAVEVVVLRIESPGKHHSITAESLVTTEYLTAGGIQTEGTLHRYHFWACVSRSNFFQLARLAVSAPLTRPCIIVNTGDPDVDSKVDQHEWLASQFPDVPSKLAGNQALISIDLARATLGYRPLPVTHSQV